MAALGETVCVLMRHVSCVMCVFLFPVPPVEPEEKGGNEEMRK